MAARIETLKALPREQVVRFDIHQRIQHFFLMSSFILLALTGLPLKFSAWGVSQWWILLWGGVDNTRLVHYVAAWVMVFLCVYHGFYLGVSTLILKRPFPYAMIPSLKDASDVMNDLRYYLGLTRNRPNHDRFNYREKFDYWAIFWGMPIMAGSGFVLMFPVLVSRFVPSWTIPIALVAHSDEAILAVGWIFIVHLFFTHLTPRSFPFNQSIFTGRVPSERYKEEHPLEYERLTGPKE